MKSLNLSRMLAKAPNYWRKFGPLDGLRLLWQVESGFAYRSETTRAYRVPGFGTVFLRDSASDHAIFWQCLVDQQYDTSIFPQHQRLMQQYRELIERKVTPLILDLGANIGLAALWFASRFPQAKILAVEPDGKNLALLQQNIAGRDQIQALHGAVWNTSGKLRIVNPEAGFAAFRVAPAQEDEEAVCAYTVEELLAIAGVDFPFIVKIDIEGAQQALFSSHTAWVERVHLIVLELDDWLLPWQGTSRPFFACVSQYPFDYLLRGENIFCFRDFRV
jgi:FkbM family methyltransferase